MEDNLLDSNQLIEKGRYVKSKSVWNDLWGLY